MQIWLVITLLGIFVHADGETTQLIEKLFGKAVRVRAPQYADLDNAASGKAHEARGSSISHTRPAVSNPCTTHLSLASLRSAHARGGRCCQERMRMEMDDQLKAATARAWGSANSGPVAATGLSSRRSLLVAALCGAVGVTSAPSAVQASSTEDDEKLFWQGFPDISKRKTIRRDAASGVWTFEQLLRGPGYVHVPIRMTMIAMKSGGLFVYAPVAPTRECLALMEPLVDQFGPVKYIVLPSAAIEHKVLAGSFARRFPSAEFYVTDRQYALPVDLSLAQLPPWTKQLPPSSKGLDLWDGEFEHEVLTQKPQLPEGNPYRIHSYQDAAFYHKPTETLLVCDALSSISSEPPAIFASQPEYLRALLFHARDDPLELVVDSPEVRRKGWERIALLSNFVFPGSAGFTLARIDPRTPMPELGWGGLLPFNWDPSWRKSFEALSANGKPTQLPLVRISISLEPEATRQWVEAVTKWYFVRVVPAHFDAPIAIGPQQFAECFDFLRRGSNDVRFCNEDVTFSNQVVDYLVADNLSKLGPLRGPSCGFV